MGIFSDGEGVARFHSVDTHRDFRRRGLAGTLVHHVSQYAFGELGATTLVMMADPAYLAIRVYRGVGFDDTESQLQILRPRDRETWYQRHREPDVCYAARWRLCTKRQSHGGVRHARSRSRFARPIG